MPGGMTSRAPSRSMSELDVGHNGERARLSRGARLAIGAIALASFVVSLVVGVTVFPHQSVNNDDAVYAY